MPFFFFRYRIPVAETLNVLISRAISSACVRLVTNLVPANATVSTSMSVTSDQGFAATARATICKVVFNASVMPGSR